MDTLAPLQCLHSNPVIKVTFPGMAFKALHTLPASSVMSLRLCLQIHWMFPQGPGWLSPTLCVSFPCPDRPRCSPSPPLGATLSFKELEPTPPTPGGPGTSSTRQPCDVASRTDFKGQGTEAQNDKVTSNMVTEVGLAAGCLLYPAVFLLSPGPPSLRSSP